MVKLLSSLEEGKRVTFLQDGDIINIKGCGVGKDGSRVYISLDRKQLTTMYIFLGLSSYL